MSAEVIPFAFEENLIRAVEIDGEPWFVGKDVCAALAISDHRQAIGRLDDDERGGCTVPTPSGVQEMTAVSEPGVYRLVFTSRRPEAERFKRWIAHDVLPALRRRGFYAAAPVDAEIADIGPAGIVNTKLALIRECRLAFGRAGARALWRRLDLPIGAEGVGPRPVERGALALLRRFLALDVGPSVAPMRRHVEWALDGSEDSRAALEAVGVLVVAGDEEGFHLHHGHGDLLDLFASIDAGEDWWRLVRSLPGNGPGKRMRVDGRQARTTFVSARWLAPD